MQNNGDGFGLENSSMCVSKTFEYEEIKFSKFFSGFFIVFFVEMFELDDIYGAPWRLSKSHFSKQRGKRRRYGR